ncbi:MAG TPA: NAD(P)-binding domain-containing protein [Candidatus Dormibacteraeota bacterium]|nr:NAD(P)-binding domain-containing protein [Candidatus Dormibacteraeota bacterium]
MDFNVAIIGAGQAGLATSYHLQHAGVDHVVLEAGRVAETWRSRRWDSFCLVTPNWSVRLPGGAYEGPEPDGFMDKKQLVDHFQRWAGGFGAPVKERCTVAALDADGDGFQLTTSEGRTRARTVVVASGGYQRAHRPANADQLPAGVDQLLAEEYSCPDALESGNVLIVGSGQTGCQLAEELHESGRKVILACGRAPWAPRRWGGGDLVRWTIDSGWWDRSAPTPQARLIGNVLTTGHGGGHDLHLRTLHRMGVELLGHYVGAEDGTVHFADDLDQTLEASDKLAATFKKKVDDYCAGMGITNDWEIPPPMKFGARTSVDLEREAITSIIWTTGYRPDYGWVHLPVFDDMGFPVQVDGRSDVPGLYFMGVHFQRKAQSAVLYGVGEDAEIVATDIVERRR